MNNYTAQKSTIATGLAALAVIGGLILITKEKAAREYQIAAREYKIKELNKYEKERAEFEKETLARSDILRENSPEDEIRNYLSEIKRLSENEGVFRNFREIDSYSKKLTNEGKRASPYILEALLDSSNHYQRLNGQMLREIYKTEIATQNITLNEPIRSALDVIPLIKFLNNQKDTTVKTSAKKVLDKYKK